MKEYAGMVAAQTAQVLLMIVSKSAIADGMSNYSFVFYSNALASLLLLPLSFIFHTRSLDRPPLSFIIVCGFFIIGLLGISPVAAAIHTAVGFRWREMKEYAGMVAAQTAQVLLMIVSKSAIADGMSNYSFVFYSNALASLLLLPLSFIFHTRSLDRPPLTFIIVCGFFIIGLLGYLAQIFGYTGISYSSATLATTLLNLIPGFTFILAIICRMETVKFGSSVTQVKFIGTLVSVAGAIMVTLYQGPQILSFSLKSEILKDLIGQPSNWVLGGIFLAIDGVFSSMYIIAQAIVLKKYPAEMIVIFAYCFVCTILSGLTSLIVEDDLSSYSLQPKKRLLSIIYSGVFGSAFQVTVQAWCVRRRGPLFVAMFHPVGIVISTVIGVIFLGDGFYLGSLLGSIVVVIGFYSVMWGKAEEEKVVAGSKMVDEQAPLLQDVE